MKPNLKLLKARALAEAKKPFQRRLKEIETEDGLSKVMEWYGKTYKDKPREKFSKWLLAQEAKAMTKIEAEITRLLEAKKPERPLVITLEWKRSYTWGKTVRSSTNRDFVSEVVSGCGYCKTSTATAYALNQEPYLLLLMALKIEEYLKKCPKTTDNDNTIHREVLGYGTGYNTLPSFEGGVGVGCHQRIIEGLGLKWSNVSSTDWVDVFQVSYD